MKARGADNDTSGDLLHSNEDVEALERTASIRSGRSWADHYAKGVKEMLSCNASQLLKT